ncbi:MAG TPA: hypothetical protein VN247_02380 [Arenimonas sp.]|nr:hypothetical protein [Arenimonas sp.]
MSFKLNLAQQPIALTSHHIISVKGRDARVFLQNQLMNDVYALDNGHWQYTGILNAQGRVLALFQLAEINSEHFLIILANLDPAWLVDYLKRFLFRSKVTITHEQEYFAQGQWSANQATFDSGHTIHPIQQEGFILNTPDKNCIRTMQILRTPAETNLHALDQWHMLDMVCGWPWIDEKLQNLWTPQMLSLQNLNAFSLKKGCYPGQEIVARTHYLGKSKRHLRTIRGLGLENGQILLQNDLEIGKIVNANQQGDFAVVVLPIELNTEWQVQTNLSTVELL